MHTEDAFTEASYPFPLYQTSQFPISQVKLGWHLSGDAFCHNCSARLIVLVASYPGLLAPAFVACSTNAGEGLVKLSHVQWHTYLDVWRSGTFLLYSCKAAFWIQETSPRLSDVERSVIIWSVFAIGSALAYLLFFREYATPPYVQVYHTTWLSFARPSPALVLQATNAGARRPGYQAIVLVQDSLPKRGRGSLVHLDTQQLAGI